MPMPMPMQDHDAVTHAAPPMPPGMGALSGAGGSMALVAGVRQLWIFRAIAIAGQIAAIVVSSELGVVLPLEPMTAVIAVLIALEAVTTVRLERQAPATHREIAGHLAVDLAAFTTLLYLSGGTANPFSLLFVLHAVLVALLLPPRLAAAGMLVVIACLSWVTGRGVPLHMESGGPVPPDLLALGAWLSFTVTVVMVTWFVVRMVGIVREHERLLHEAAEKARIDATILRIGTLATGAVHELATPMTTMAVIAGEIAREAGTPALHRDAGILAAQIDACRQTISRLLAATDHARAEGGGRERLDAFLDGIAQRCRTLRPGVVLKSTWESDLPAPEIFAERALRQAILVLLDNAADASPHDVAMTARWNADVLRVLIDDRGGGIPRTHLDKLGRVFFSTKLPGKGAGLGLVLASNAVRHLGGTLRWESRPGGGTRAEMVLPLRALKLPETG